jgi:flagellar biosynthesis GTPase FlhF
MKIIKFEGASMRETLAKVKAELGDQAVVVSTRQIRRVLLGSAYEIAAAIDQDDTARRSRRRRPRRARWRGRRWTTARSSAWSRRCAPSCGRCGR